MKKFIFSLQGLLNARAAQKEAIEHELRAAQSKLLGEEKLLQEICRQIEQILTTPMPMQAPTGTDFLLRERYLNATKRRRKEQQVRREAAAAAVKVCLSKLRLADIELKKMEKLQGREREEWSREYQREEQKINDEIGMSGNFYRELPS